MGRPAKARIGGRRLRRIGVAGAFACVFVAALDASPAFSQGPTLNERLTRNTQGRAASRMLVEANQLVYDNDNNKVLAVGNAQIYHEGKSLEADRVTYDRNTRRVFAEGNVRMVDENGTVTYGDRFELTDNFRDGFIDSLRVESTTVERGETLKIRFAAPRAERAGGETTVFERGTYTACEPCKDNPERPPFWQVRAGKIIHNNEERTIYYENATVEIYGHPIAWLPYFWTPDNTVKRKTGFLTPRYLRSTALGTGASLPFFWNLAPNYDLTITPTYLSRQGFLGAVEWRHRLINGSYNVRASGIFQKDTSAFLPAPLGPGNKEFRGAIESAGVFFLNERWRFGWDVTAQTDKWFVDHYRIGAQNIQALYFRDIISTVYLRGQGDRSFFDARGYYFQPTSALDWQKQQPVVGLLDYNRRWNLAGPIGGEVGLDLNVTHVTRDEAQFSYLYRRGAVDQNGVLVNPLSYPPLFPGMPFEGCVLYTRQDCIIRGLAGNHTRVSATLDWRRQIIDPIGQVWTPFASARVDGVWFQSNYSAVPGTANNYAALFVNNAVPGGVAGANNSFGRVMPAVGLQYRFPLVATTSWGTHILEPIASIVARPNEPRLGAFPNNDAQSLIFDDTNLMQTDKFSGYDRVEGGVRANVGVQYTFQGANGAFGSFLFGQSYHVAGRNSFLQPDIANTGLNSGLDKSRSDYVARAVLSTGPNFSFMSRANFHDRNFSLQRLELGPSFNFDPLSGSILYARYAAQPELGYPFRREGVVLSGNLKLNTNWSVMSSAVFDLDRYLVAREAVLQNVAGVTGNNNRFSMSSLSFGLQYKDECTIFSVQYVASGFRDAFNGQTAPTRALFVKLELRSLGETGFQQNLAGPVSSRDGLSVR